MEQDYHNGLVEAVLFLENEPLDIASLTRITELSREHVHAALTSLQQEYQAPAHGLELVQIADGYTFRPKKDHWDRLKPYYGKKNGGRLSKAALETLSIIAYSQPVTRMEIESIRGVSADGMIKLLSEKNLIKEIGRKDSPGKPVQFGTTKEFLKYFQLSSIADLPKLDELDRDRFEMNE
jgi:segregation and condensation protein B